MDKFSVFQEDIYAVDESVTLVIKVPWTELSTDSRSMLQNLCHAIKQRPAPSIQHITELELGHIQVLPKKMVLFGHQVEGLKLHLPSPFRHTLATLTSHTDTLVNDPERKKELWGAIQLMFVQRA